LKLYCYKLLYIHKMPKMPKIPKISLPNPMVLIPLSISITMVACITKTIDYYGKKMKK